MMKTWLKFASSCSSLSSNVPVWRIYPFPNCWKKTRALLDRLGRAMVSNLCPGRLLSNSGFSERSGHSSVLDESIISKSGDRLGYGRGYYDKFLSSTGAVKISLTYSKQIVKSIPSESHDIKIDLIITEDEIIKVS